MEDESNVDNNDVHDNEEETQLHNTIERNKDDDIKKDSDNESRLSSNLDEWENELKLNLNVFYFWMSIVWLNLLKIKFVENLKFNERK